MIVRKRRRGKERDTTTHLIKNSSFTHACHVTKFSLVLSRFESHWGLYDPFLASSPPSHLSCQLESNNMAYCWLLVEICRPLSLSMPARDTLKA